MARLTRTGFPRVVHLVTQRGDGRFQHPRSSFMIAICIKMVYPSLHAPHRDRFRSAAPCAKDERPPCSTVFNGDFDVSAKFSAG
jgi:hypothetical protein